MRPVADRGFLKIPYGEPALPRTRPGDHRLTVASIVSRRTGRTFPELACSSLSGIPGSLRDLTASCLAKARPFVTERTIEAHVKQIFHKAQPQRRARLRPPRPCRARLPAPAGLSPRRTRRHQSQVLSRIPQVALASVRERGAPNRTICMPPACIRHSGHPRRVGDQAAHARCRPSHCVTSPGATAA